MYFPDTKKVTKNHTVKFTERFPSKTEFHADDDNPDDFIPLVPSVNQDGAVSEGEDADGAANVLTPEEPDGEDADDATNELTPEAPLNRTQRPRNPPKHLNDYVCQFDSVYRVSIGYVDECYKVSTFVPKTYSAAMKSEEKDEWSQAMDSEMNSMIENDTYQVVQLPEGKKAVKGRWVYSLKNDPSGNIVHKARYVAKGYAQVAGVDYSETFSPTAKMTTIRILMQYAAEHGLPVHQLDVKTAYLNAPIDCEVYLEQPPGYTVKNNNETMVWKLKKSLYGLKQSGRNWNSLLDNFFKEHGFTRSNCDACLYMKGERYPTLVLIWVDDIVIVSKQNEMMQTKKILKDRFKMKDLGPISWFLGIQFLQTEEGISMNQSYYLSGVLERFQMSECKPRATPCEPKFDVEEGPSTNNNSDDDVRRYREIIGSLVYAMSCTRPDLAWIVTKLSQHLSNPSPSDWTTVKHVLRYIKHTVQHKLFYRKSGSGLKLEGFSDSDWASSSDRRSTTGYCFRLNEDGGLVSWKTRKQPTIALSSCEAEYMALTAAAQEAISLKMLLKDFTAEEDNKLPTLIRGDNQGSLDLAQNPVHHQRSKHIDIKYHFIREKCADGDIKLQYVSTAENVADLMTKAATKQKLEIFHRDLFGNI